MRAKRGVAIARRKYRRKLNKQMRGLVMGLSQYRHAMEIRKKSLMYAFRDRKQRKRMFRSLWITRLSAAARANDLTYSRFIEGLKKLGIQVNRKMLAELAVADRATFDDLVKQIKGVVTPAGKK